MVGGTSGHGEPTTRLGVTGFAAHSSGGPFRQFAKDGLKEHEICDLVSGRGGRVNVARNFARLCIFGFQFVLSTRCE